MAGHSFPIRCPACGHPFLTHLDHPQMVQACPQCGFNGLRGQFAPADPSALRKESKRFAPTGSAPQAMAWEVRHYSAPVQTLVQPLFHPVVPAASSSPPSPPAQGTANWAAVQAYQEMMEARQKSAPAPDPYQNLEPTATAAPPALQPSADWAPMKPSHMPKLTPWPGLEQATGGGDPLASWNPGPRQRSIPWRWLLASMVVIGLIVTLVIERKRANETVARLTAESRAATERPTPLVTEEDLNNGTIKKAIPVAEKTVPPECLLTPAQSELIARPLLDKLFAADSEAARLACIAFPAKNRDSVEDFFSRHGRVQVKKLSASTTTQPAPRAR